tara:strand:+ start:512 stop:1009 length:498 start_codon:yes stop_codon:yes gene_type:complete
MLYKIFLNSFILSLTFILNVSAGVINYGIVEISSNEIKNDTDIKKNKITLKEAVIKFKDGSIYVGPIKKNKLSGKGKLTLSDGTVYEGKFKSNKFINKINRKNRTFIKINLKKGLDVKHQIKVPGLSDWYPADVANGEFKLSKKGQLMVSQDKKSNDGGGGGGGC